VQTVVVWGVLVQPIVDFVGGDLDFSDCRARIINEPFVVYVADRPTSDVGLSLRVYVMFCIERLFAMACVCVRVVALCKTDRR